MKPADSGLHTSGGADDQAWAAHRAWGIERAQAENDEPQPQVLFAFGFWNLKPAP